MTDATFARSSTQTASAPIRDTRASAGASGATETVEGHCVSRIRVCLVGPSLDILGGQAVQAARLLRHLRQMPGHEVDFLPVNPRLPTLIRGLQEVKYLRTILTTLAYVSSLVRRLRRYDVIHVFSASYFSFILAPLPAMLIARAFGKRVVLNYRSGQADDHLRRSAFAARCMRLAHVIVVPSDYLVGVFADHGLASQAIPNIVDIAAIPHRERRIVQPLLLSNRNLEPLYNVACVLRAFALVQARVPSSRLTVIGDGSERIRLSALAAELGLQHVEFVGKVPPARMADYYLAADIYVNAPDIDNMPGSIIEAFAAGLPVVSTNAGGIKCMVRHGENGLLVERGDHVALASEVLRLLQEPDLALRLARCARAECAERYVWPAVSAQWDELYRGEFESLARKH